MTEPNSNLEGLKFLVKSGQQEPKVSLINMSDSPKTNAPLSNSFVNVPIVTDWQELNSQAVIFGVPHGKPYDKNLFPNDQSAAPNALRAASPRIIISDEAVDMDNKDLFSLSDIILVDGGDIPLHDNNIAQHYADAEKAVRYATKKGIIPVSIGGDDGVTNPVIRGLDCLSDITLVQIDAHLDWRNERFGETDGYSSPMRRASELSHVSSIHQVGIRSFGSALQSDIVDAQNWGAHLHLARDIHKNGIQAVINSMPQDGPFFITLDVDGLDPAIMPGTVARAPGGLDWWQTIELFEGLAERGDIVGINVVELAPKYDVNQLSLIAVGRLILKILMLQLSKL